MTEEEEYIDCTFTVGLALAFAKKYKEPLDVAVRNSSLKVLGRIRYPRVKNLFLGIAMEESPAVAFTIISNQVFSSGLITS